MSCDIDLKQIANGTTNQIIVAGASIPAYQTVGGDLTLAGGTFTIANGAVTNAKAADMAANTVKVRNAGTSGDPSDLAVTNTQVLIGNGTGFTAAALSGDVTMTNGGVVSIGSAKVGETELDNADGAVDAQSFVLPTGYSAAAGTVVAGDTIDAAIRKLDGNISSLASGLSWKDAAIAATTADLPASTYANGASGVGATLTADANGAIPAQDGVSLSVNDRFLVKDQTAGLENGIYDVTQLGDGSNPWILTRVVDADESAEIDGAAIFVQQGTASEDLAFVQTADAPTMGTTALSFSQFSSTLTLGGTPSTIEPDDAAAAGSSSSGARSDHVHAIVAAAAGTIQPDDAAAEGSATSFARSDHTHGITAAIAGTIEPDDSAAEGVATSFSRSDHQHGIAAAIAGASAPGDSAAEGSSTSFARADHLHGRESFLVEQITTQTITGTDTAITDTLNSVPTTFLGLFLNGQLMLEGAGNVYTRSSQTITWLASSGCAVDLATSDNLEAWYIA
jgi:hypothetical protein